MVNLHMREIEIFRQLLQYIDQHYTPVDGLYEDKFELLSSYKPLEEEDDGIFPPFYIKYNKEKEFCKTLLEYINGDFESLQIFCKKASLSKTAFEEICKEGYCPPKKALCRLIIVAKFDYEKAMKLLKVARIHWYNYNKFDVAMDFFFKKKVGDLTIVNKLLFLLDLPLLGSSLG